MHKTIIGKTDLNVSAVCLGTGSFGTSIDENTSFDLIDSFLDAGGNFLDTANVYGKWASDKKNHSEITIGKWLKTREKRHEIIFGTKGGHPELSSMDQLRLAPDEIKKDIEESLISMKIDHIDIYWLHTDDPSYPAGEILETLNELVREGKTRYIGCSNWKVERIKSALEYAIKNRLNCFMANQMMWNLAIPDITTMRIPGMAVMNKECIEFHRKNDFTAIPYTSQANGFFTKALKVGFWDSSEHKELKKLYSNNNNAALVAKVGELADKMGVSGTQIALAYLLNQKITTIPIIGPRRIDQLKDSLDATEIKLEESVVDWMNMTKFSH